MKFLSLLCLALPLVFGSGCASTGYWSAPPRGADEAMAAAPRAVPLKVANPEAAAAVLAMPGDLCLLHLGNSRMGSFVKQLGAYPAGVVDLLDLQDPMVKFLHSEIVTDVTPHQLRTLGFYPIEKQWHHNQFVKSFALYGVNDFPARAPGALRKAADHRAWARTGYCGDFVSWTYDNQLYSWWNRVPGLRNVIGVIYPPEAIQTADNLANSPDTRLLIEFQNNEIIYPAVVPTGELLHRLHLAGGSKHPRIKRHAGEIIDLLKRHRILGADGGVLQPHFRFVL